MKTLIVLLMLCLPIMAQDSTKNQWYDISFHQINPDMPQDSIVKYMYWDEDSNSWEWFIPPPDTLNWSELTEDSAGVGYAVITISDMQPDTLKVEWGWYIYRMTMWGMMIEQETVEVGLREDGVVVWRRK